jgi:hypothetical protein
MMHKSGLEGRIAAVQARTGRNFHAYGDAAYRRTPQVQRAIKGRLSVRARILNKKMKSLRISVEWGFGGVHQQWAYLTYSKGMKMFKQPVAKMYSCATVLYNLYTCAHGNTATKHFRVAPPTMEAYLHA